MEQQQSFLDELTQALKKEKQDKPQYNTVSDNNTLVNTINTIATSGSIDDIINKKIESAIDIAIKKHKDEIVKKMDVLQKKLEQEIINNIIEINKKIKDRDTNINSLEPQIKEIIKTTLRDFFIK